jgi:hypothetical protein
MNCASYQRCPPPNYSDARAAMALGILILLPCTDTETAYRASRVADHVSRDAAVPDRHQHSATSNLPAIAPGGLALRPVRLPRAPLSLNTDLQSSLQSSFVKLPSYQKGSPSD